MRKKLRQRPQIRQMLTEPYTSQEISNAVKNLKNRKPIGKDGIPGEVYKALGGWVTKPWP